MHAFLIATPLGLRSAASLLAELQLRNITVRERLVMRPWSVAASQLYRRSSTPSAIARAARFEQRWRQLFPADEAECWRLGTRDDHERLVHAKAELRSRFPSVPLGPVQAGEPPFQLHAFHAPDGDAITAEAARIFPFLQGVHGR